MIRGDDGTAVRSRADLFRAPLASRALAGAAVALLTACASAPPPPDWQLNAHGAIERAATAYLTGNARVEAAEFARARAEVARTGRTDLLATLELTRCAWRVASLQFADRCSGFAPLAADAGPTELAYDRYLSGQGVAADAALLPPAQRAVAAGSASPATLKTIADPLSRLVAAGAMLRYGTADPDVLVLAADTASAEGWSRPLLAWLQALRLRAEAAGDADAAARLRRRIAQIEGPGAAASAPAAAAAAAAKR